MDWRTRVEKALSHHRGRGVVVAVSGGADSVGLLCLLRALGDEFELRLSVAHLDHGVRGETSRADAEFVAELAHSLGLPFDLGTWTPARPAHFEADARKARYDWLVEVAKRREASCVAVGHTRDDQAETILHRILRGTGPRGLSGMRRRRPLIKGVTLIRPLLDVGRAEVRDYLGSIGQSFREDASNNDLARTRNRIRHDLLPKLAAEYNPRAAEALARLGALASDGVARASRRVERIAREAVISADPGEIVIRRAPLDALTQVMRAEVFRAAWRRAGWPEGRMTAARWLRLANTPAGWEGRYAVARRIEVRFDREVARLSASIWEVAASPAKLPVPGWAESLGVTIAATLDPADARDEELDLDRIKTWSDSRGERFLDLTAPRDGDRFDPLGMAGGTQALNDFFRGRGVSKHDRRRSLVVRDRVGIVWVVGHRIADRVRVTDQTRRRLYLRQSGITPLPRWE